MPLTQLAYRIVKRGVRRLPPELLRLRPYTVYSIPATRFDGSIALPPATADESIRWADPAEGHGLLSGLADQANLADWDAPTRRLAVTLHGPDPVACVWVARADYTEQELGLRYRLDSADRWVYAAHVLSGARGRGVYGRLLGFVGGRLRAEGVSRLVLGVARGNSASLRAHDRWRPEPIGRVFALRSLGVTLCLASGQVRRRGLPVRAGSPIELGIGPA
ncbi:MAG: hypothetical protein AAF790_05410 [Planctomycetota bacterium]